MSGKIVTLPRKRSREDIEEEDDIELIAVAEKNKWMDVIIAEKKRWILVRSESTNNFAQPYNKHFEPLFVYRRPNKHTVYDFHLFDLEEGKFYPRCFQSLVQCVFSETADMVFAGGKILFFGGRRPNLLGLSALIRSLESQLSSGDPNSLVCPYKWGSLPGQEYYLGFSTFGITPYIESPEKIKEESKSGTWSPIANHYTWDTRCVCIDGVVYNFGDQLMSNGPQVYDPASGKFWEQLNSVPSELVGCKVAKAPVADPCNKRIIMKLEGETIETYGLYAFTPGSGKWDCLVQGFPCWTSGTMVVHDVLYISTALADQVLVAFDIRRMDFLSISWDNPPLLKDFNILGWRVKFDALHLLSAHTEIKDGKLHVVGEFCLSRNETSRAGDYCMVVFLKCSFDHNVEDGTITLSKISDHIYDLTCTEGVLNYLAF